MFTRISRSDGRSYLQLVESFRENGKVKQRMVASLDRLDEVKVKALISDLERSIGIKPAAAEQSVTATLPISFASTRAYGDLCALHCLRQKLGLGTALQHSLRSSRRQFDVDVNASQI